MQGPLDPSISQLEGLEILDLHGNTVSALPRSISSLARLRILNISENSFENLCFADLSKLPLTEILARKNKLTGTLITDVEALPNLQSLDISVNRLSHIVPEGAVLSLPSLHQLTVSMNSLEALPDLSNWTSLLTLTADENSITCFPAGFLSLEKLRHADFSSNDIRVVPPEVARMDSLAMLRLAGNPLRGSDRKFTSITTEELKDALANRLEPPPPYQAQATESVLAGKVRGDFNQNQQPADALGQEEGSSDMDDFATPPTSAPNSPSRSEHGWPVKSGGILDRSRTESAALNPDTCAEVAQGNMVRDVQLHHNSFSTIPESLSIFAQTLTCLSLAHNQLLSNTYLTATLALPSLTELNLSANNMTSIIPLTTHLAAPRLVKLDISTNRITLLPSHPLRSTFPGLDVLLASDNHITSLDPDTITGLSVVNIANNDIGHLDPRLGLLGGRGLRKLEVGGNRFRVPRWSVLEQGTEETLRWLRGRITVGEGEGYTGVD